MFLVCLMKQAPGVIPLVIVCSVWIPTTEAPKTPVLLLKAQESKGPAVDWPLPPRPLSETAGEARLEPMFRWGPPATRSRASVWKRISPTPASDPRWASRLQRTRLSTQPSPRESPSLRQTRPCRASGAASVTWSGRARLCDRLRITRPSEGGSLSVWTEETQVLEYTLEDFFTQHWLTDCWHHTPISARLIKLD